MFSPVPGWERRTSQEAARLTLIAALFMLGIIIGIFLGLNSRQGMPYCQEDEVVLFNLPERDTFWCQHIDTLPAMFSTLQSTAN